MTPCMTVIRLLARPMLASTFVWGGVQGLRNAPALAAKAKPVNDAVRGLAGKVAPQVPVPEDDATLVRINAGVHIAAGLALATGRMPRLSALMLAGTVLPTTVAGHRWWEEKDKAARTAALTHFFKNISMLGGLVLAAVDTQGRPGVAWRTQHAVGSARRSARHLRKEASSQAKSAARTVRK
jgi:putative oxidoreductase